MRLLLLLSILACSCNTDGDPSALVALERRSGRPWRVVLHPSTGLATIAHAPPGDRPATSDADEAAPPLARRFLQESPGLFGAAVDRDNLWLRDVITDGRGGARARFETRVAGLPVDGGDVLITVGPDGQVHGAAGQFLPDTRMAASGTVGELAAVAVALRTVGAGSVEEPPVRVALASGTQLLPAWRIQVVDRDAALHRELLIDAVTGEVRRHRDRLRHVAAVRGTGVGSDGTVRVLDLMFDDDRYYLRDETRSAGGIRTYSARQTQRRPGYVIWSDTSDRWDTGVFAAGAAVDAHAHAATVVDYLTDVLGREAPAFRLTVHFGRGTWDAFWDGSQAVFGDGDGLSLAAALDVVAHELFHAVTDADAGLLYEGEPGALSESLSDVFAVFVERHGGSRDWTIGEALGDPFRDLSRPAHMRDFVDLPYTPEEDMGGVHANSVIPSHAAYLVAKAIGPRPTALIWSRAVRLYTGPAARFADFAEATRAAAVDLHGARSSQVDAVDQAWDAVGVTE
jgi:bacillolysin